VAEIWNTLLQLGDNLGTLIIELLRLTLHWSLLLAWIAWWLWGVNWNTAWAVLAQGAWAPLALLIITSALVWSRLSPSACDCLGFVSVPNFWWQLGGVSLLAALTLLCGWLQGVFGWTPAEVNLDPPPAARHGHGHGHHH
jgi:hypothetical protein